MRSLSKEVFWNLFHHAPWSTHTFQRDPDPTYREVHAARRMRAMQVHACKEYLGLFITAINDL